MQKYLFTLLISFLSPMTLADSYGYLAFWHHPNDAQSVPHTKTTRENASQADADAELNTFCQQYDQQLSPNTSGCFAVTPLQNTCAAAAWSHKRGLMRPNNIYIATDPDFKRVAKLALKSCKKDNGWFARCEVETVYCTDGQQYQPSS